MVKKRERRKYPTDEVAFQVLGTREFTRVDVAKTFETPYWWGQRRVCRWLKEKKIVEIEEGLFCIKPEFLL